MISGTRVVFLFGILCLKSRRDRVHGAFVAELLPRCTCEWVGCCCALPNLRSTAGVSHLVEKLARVFLSYMHLLNGVVLLQVVFIRCWK